MRRTLALGAALLAAVALAATVGIGVLGHSRPRVLVGDRSRPLTYAALGDSTVAGVGASEPGRNYVSRLHAHLRSVYPHARVTNLGVSGATAADVVAEQLPRAVALGPDLVSLSIGPNDITQGRDVRQYERDVDLILATLSRETAAVLLVNLIPDLAVTPRFKGGENEAAVGRRTVLFNAALGRAARAHGAEIVDLYSLSRREVPRRPELIAGDGYHPSDQGHTRWALAMWQGVRARIERD